MDPDVCKEDPVQWITGLRDLNVHRLTDSDTRRAKCTREDQTKIKPGSALIQIKL